MDTFVTALTTGITADTLWGYIASFAPFVILIFGVAVGYRLLRRVINKGVKLKPGV